MAAHPLCVRLVLKIAITPPRQEVFDDAQRTAYRLGANGQLETLLAYPAGRTEPALNLLLPQSGAPADGRHKWSANCSHLLYDVLSDFLVNHEVLGGADVVIQPTRLTHELVGALGGRVLLPDSAEALAWADKGLAQLENSWRFAGAQHSFITHLWQRKLAAVSTPPGSRRHVLIERHIRYREWAHNRNFHDSGRLLEQLARQGFDFQPVRLEEMTLSEQIAVFRDAEIIVATHGSGLVWLPFCRPGTVCVEVLTPYFFKDGRPKSDFWHIGRQARIRYVPYLCEQVVGKPESAYENDAVVSADVLLRLIEFGLSRSATPLG